MPTEPTEAERAVAAAQEIIAAATLVFESGDLNTALPILSGIPAQDGLGVLFGMFVSHLQVISQLSGVTVPDLLRIVGLRTARMSNTLEGLQ